MANNLKPQNPRNVFQHQSHPSNRPRPPGGVGQDKGAEKSGRAASAQPDPLEKQSRARLMDTELFRVNKLDNTKVKLVHRTIHLHPIDDEELKHIATTDGLSVSSVGATAVHEWILWKIHKREESLMYPKLRQIIREEQQASGNRIVFFFMRIAIASEQARILITEVLKRVFIVITRIEKLITFLTNGKEQKSQSTKEDTRSYIEIFNTIVEKSYKMARANVFRKSYDMKKMLAEWEAWGKEETANKKSRE